MSDLKGQARHLAKQRKSSRGISRSSPSRGTLLSIGASDCRFHSGFGVEHEFFGSAFDVCRVAEALRSIYEPRLLPPYAEPAFQCLRSKDQLTIAGRVGKSISANCII